MKDEPRYILYNENDVPHEVWSLSAFCQEQGLDVQAMKNLVRGRTKQHNGWHMDEVRTAKDVLQADDINQMLEGRWPTVYSK